MCAHFCVHISVTNLGIVGYLYNALWGLLDWSICLYATAGQLFDNKVIVNVNIRLFSRYGLTHYKSCSMELNAL